jgi:hypothetical protein
MKSADVDQNGKIDEDEFVAFVLDKQYRSAKGDWKKLAFKNILPFHYQHLGISGIFVD